MYDFEILVDHENLVTISCFCTFLIFIQSYILNFCIYFKCFFLYLYIYISREISIEHPGVGLASLSPNNGGLFTRYPVNASVNGDLNRGHNIFLD